MKVYTFVDKTLTTKEVNGKHPYQRVIQNQQSRSSRNKAVFGSLNGIVTTRTSNLSIDLGFSGAFFIFPAWDYSGNAKLLGTPL